MAHFRALTGAAAGGLPQPIRTAAPKSNTKTVANSFGGKYLQDAVGIDVKRHLDLRHATWHRRDTVQVELAKDVVVLREPPLALVHLPRGSQTGDASVNQSAEHQTTEPAASHTRLVVVVLPAG